MDHIEIYVSDLAQSKAFYDYLLIKQLGFFEFQRWPEGISYKKGEFYLVFVQVKSKEKTTPFKRTHIGLNHLAFKIESREQLDQLHTYYQTTVPTALLYDTRYPYAGGQHHYALYIEDPDRIKVEVVFQS